MLAPYSRLTTPLLREFLWIGRVQGQTYKGLHRRRIPFGAEQIGTRSRGLRMDLLRCGISLRLMSPSGQRRTCTILSARSCGRSKRSSRLADCLSQGDFWPAETHRDPSGDKPQHELAGVTIIIWQVISKLDAVSSVLCHDPHFRGWSVCRKAVSVNRQPMSFGKVEKHCRIATCGNDSPGRGIRPEPVLFKMLLPHHTLHSILSI